MRMLTTKPAQIKSLNDKKYMSYYFGINETKAHDYEMDTIEAKSLEEAKQIFAKIHPEDVKNIDYINEELSLINLTE